MNAVNKISNTTAADKLKLLQFLRALVAEVADIEAVHSFSKTQFLISGRKEICMLANITIQVMAAAK